MRARLPVALLATAAVGVAAAAGVGVPVSASGAPTTATGITPLPPSPADPQHPIDDPALIKAIAVARVETTNGTPSAPAVTVEVLHDGHDTAVQQRITELGGSGMVAVGDSLVQATVPIRSLDALALSPGITYVRKATANKVDPGRFDHHIDAAQPQVGAHTTSGVTITGANVWQSAGITGAGVKVGIIDYF